MENIQGPKLDWGGVHAGQKAGSEREKAWGNYHWEDQSEFASG